MLNTPCGSLSSIEASARRNEPTPGAAVAPGLGVFLLRGIFSWRGCIRVLYSVAKCGRNRLVDGRNQGQMTSKDVRTTVDGQTSVELNSQDIKTQVVCLAMSDSVVYKPQLVFEWSCCNGMCNLCEGFGTSQCTYLCLPLIYNGLRLIMPQLYPC
jgi:hypothetical protein